MRRTKITMMLYIVAFIVASVLLTVRGYTGYVFLMVMLASGLYWLRLAVGGLSAQINTVRWARKLFFFSLIILLVLSAMLAVGALLP